MKKWNMMLLILAMLALPATGMAQDLPDFLSAVYTGAKEGLEQGAMQAMAAMDQELTLEVIPESARIEEGQTILLTVKAGNPRPQEETVTVTLSLPKRLNIAPDAAWEAVLPAAQIDPQTSTRGSATRSPSARSGPESSFLASASPSSTVSDTQTGKLSTALPGASAAASART